MSTKTFVAPNLPIKSVLCFRNRAEIRREFEVSLEKGLNTVIVERLPASLISNSIRVDGESSNEHATLRDVQYKESFTPEEDNYSDELKALIKDLEDLKEEQAKLNDQEALLETRSKALDRLVENLICQTPRDCTVMVTDEVVDSFNRTFNYYETKQAESKASLRAVQVEKKALDKKISNLEKRVHELKNIDNFKRSVHISLDAEEDTTITLKLQYNVHGASWETSYDLRVDTKTKKLSLHYLASIRQMTGEDWNDVLISLSTNEPEDAGQLPQLNTLIAKFEEKFQASGYGGFGAAPQAAVAMFKSREVSSDENSLRRTLRKHAATVSSSLVATTYNLPLERTILTRHDETKLTIAVKTLDYDVERQVVPSKSKTVFLVASVLNSTDLHLIEGPAKVYVDNCYANTLNLKQISPNERFQVELGKDPNVKVEYKPRDTFQQQSGMIQKSNVTANEQKIVLKNNNQENVVVTVFDQVPKSNDERIKVKLGMPDIKRVEKKAGHRKNEIGTFLTEQNILEWTVEVPAGGQSELHIKYNVEYPQNENVVYAEQY
ncbi:unnamed protein product [Bursaphelenchus xylophilus]|uniref:(pine wood nematode) hypothetical protein n=1 Tax=Bursaphelenchus xylophilus TaxID=6326 RepID=A0A1I7RJV2_BURXY|nr:unnamed protein product [Bursaphelenchus xylophilus]CAG9129086.1 unnamed protein product [Bursaphelenchus xylophilus]